jgi:hypothetical protein
MDRTGSREVIAAVVAMLCAAAYVGVLVLFAISPAFEELLAAAVVAGITGYLLTRLACSLLAAASADTAVIWRIGKAYGLTALVAFGVALAVSSHRCDGLLQCSMATGAAAARALFWPIYASFAFFPAGAAFAIFVLFAIVLAALLVLAWDRHVDRPSRAAAGGQALRIENPGAAMGSEKVPSSH